MRKSLFFLLSFFMLNAMAQNEIYKVDLSGKFLKDYEFSNKSNVSDIITKDTPVKIAQIVHSFEKGKDYFYLVLNDRQRPIFNKIEETIGLEYTTIQDYWNIQVLNKVLGELNKKGYQNDLRSDVESDALEYVSRIKESDLDLKDPYLENYIYGIISKIVPSYLIDGRPYNVNLLIQNSPMLDLSIYPNGTLVITTGMLSCLHTEDELAAVLSHEIAHFVLDHGVQNVNKAVTRQKRADFWSSMATGIAAVAEGVASSKRGNENTGLATLGVAIASSIVSQQIVKRLGMEYNHDQESEADKIAVELLSLLGYDRNALSTAFSRMWTVLKAERDNSMYFASYTHPAMIERIAANGAVQDDKKDELFEKRISSAISATAAMYFYGGRYKQSAQLISQNIENKVATSDDYLLKAQCLLNLYSSSDYYIQILDLISMAQRIDTNNIKAYKAEILAYLRMDDMYKSISLLKAYKERLNTYKNNTFINSELKWSDEMLAKLEVMKNK